MINIQDRVNSLVELADSSITQQTNGHIKSEWKVMTQGNDKPIMTFPKTYTDNEIFSIMDFAKKYELKALNAGIKFQKNKQNGLLKELIDNQKKLIEALKKDNERLAEALEREMFKHIGIGEANKNKEAMHSN